MKKYDYREELMFYMYDNDMERFCTNVIQYFKNDLKINLTCVGTKDNEITFNFIADKLSLNLLFIYDNSLFNYSYKFNGIYECSTYKGSRNIINKLYWFIRDKYLIVTKKEPLYCNDCGKQIGWIFNDFGNEDDSICCIGSKSQPENVMYDYYELHRCDECGNFYCDDCTSYDYDYNFTCDSCKEKHFNEHKEKKCDGECWNCAYDNVCNYEENLLNSNWKSCRFDEDDDRYEECDDCEYRDECLSDAEDNRSGYAAFCDCIVGHGYDSMDEFWECNGI
jgi:hypothetical protein